MKKSILYLLTLLLVQTGFAQIDRSTYPEPAQAREIKLGNADAFVLPNGLKVFVVENNKLPRVAFSLVLDRDPILEGDKSGMLGMVGEMLTGGTSNRSKDELDEEVDFIGASLSAGSTSLFASSLKKHQDKVLELMTDVLYNATFPEEELDKLKKQAISGLAASKDDPNAISSRLASALNFGKDHPYGEIDTEATINNITVADIKSYYATYFKPNIAYLAIVGDITKAEAETLANKYFAAWKPGDVPSKTYAMPQAPEANTVALVDRSASVQSVVNITYPMEMSLSDSDYLATRILNYILGGGSSSRLFMNLREDKGYTYGAYSSIGSDKLVTSFRANASVKQTATDSAIHEMVYEIRNLRDNGVTEEELEAAKSNLSGSFGRSLESPSTIANFAINTQRYQLPDDFYTSYLQRLNALTVEDINAAAKKYLKPDNMYITVVGNGAVIQESLMAFGEVNRFTNMADPERQIAMDENLTANDVLNRYFEAIGGRDKAEAIKTSKMEAEAEIQGMKLNMSYVYDENEGKFSNKVSMMGNVASHVVIKDGKATVTGMGNSQELNDEQFEAVKMSMFIFPELHFDDLGYMVELQGIQEVEGVEAYKLMVSNPTGTSQANYYSVDTGLKVKTESQENGDMIYTDYQEVDGILYPMMMTMKSPMIPMPLASKVQQLEFNVPITEADLK
ncbi:insulinase family protein [Cecembia lonarensis]|uniref:Peptidase M16 inactive domain protein n=1 Tax=Cecembia lonarensis (strain CCUG 58316 / KCTC 22772 / LW9) TaxID=1225176 RepID=K1KUF7_CECL9|nr:insulinase family protein [Cecembia lonarensis]EKB47755.1 Peptidase M16 inactive domain protein [Cecembia lonarensis LW9]